MMLSGTLLHNFFDREAIFVVRLVDRTLRQRFQLQEFADMGLILPDEILERIGNDRRSLRDLKIGEIEGIDRKVLRITGKEPAIRLPMKPGERINVEFAVRLRDEKPSKALLAEPFLFDIEQELDLPRGFFNEREEKMLEVGGVRFELDFAGAARKRDNGGRNPDLTLVDLRLNLKVERLSKMRSLDATMLDSPHLSPGEPLELTVEGDDHANGMRRLTLDVDGEERAVQKAIA